MPRKKGGAVGCDYYIQKWGVLRFSTSWRTMIIQGGDSQLWFKSDEGTQRPSPGVCSVIKGMMAVFKTFHLGMNRSWGLGYEN